jgi:hypothetical protein
MHDLVTHTHRFVNVISPRTAMLHADLSDACFPTLIKIWAQSIKKELKSTRETSMISLVMLAMKDKPDSRFQ